MSDSSPAAGARFTLSATVRNTGDGEAPATTLRYYQSTDATITTADAEVGTDAVGGLAAAGTSEESISLTAPSDAGTYYYGACVDAVTNESDATNNCSASMAVRVSGMPSGTIPIRDFRVTIPSACSREVQVCVRDHQCEDGDIARVSVNGGVVFSGELFNEWACQIVPVQEGRNVVEFLAVNGTGFKGQCDHSDVNTGQIEVLSSSGGVTQTWSHAGGAGSAANMNVVIGQTSPDISLNCAARFRR